MRALPYGTAAGRICAPGPRAALALFALVLVAVLLSANRALATPQVLVATMSGSQEVPANSNAGAGTCQVTIDPPNGEVALAGTFSSLSGAATKVVLRGPASPGATGPFLASATNVTSAGSGSFSSGSITIVTPQAMASILAGLAYCEVDDTAYPSGEIRGQVLAQGAPAAPIWLLASLAGLLGAAGAWISSRRSRALPGASGC